MGISFRDDTQKWVVRIRNKKLNIDYTKSFKSKTIAKKDERRVLAEIEAGTFMKEDNRMTFKEATELYMKNIANLHCKDTTLESYQGYLNNHINPYFSDKRLCNITKLDCDKFVKYLSEKNCNHVRRTKKGIVKVAQSKKLSNETINHIIFLSNAIFEYMVDSDVIAKNPMKKVKKLKSDKKQTDFLTTKECNSLLKCAKDFYPKYYPILLLAIVTGMRQGEILALTWDDIDFKNHTIFINKSYSHGRLSTPKTNSSIRNIKVPSPVMKILKEYYLRVQKNKLNLVFPNESGNYMNCRNLVNRFFKPCLEKANVKDITWHKLRHSCITALAENHVELKAVQNHVGHSSELTTMRIYTHITDNMENELVDVLGRVFAC